MLSHIDATTIAAHLALLGVAYLLAFPIAWNRERYSRSAGLRTFPLIAVATCGFMLVGLEVLSSSDAQARALAGLITGMGFIGGGAILKGEGSVSGTAPAASLWSTGAIGVAVAWPRFEIALAISLLTFATLQFIPHVKAVVDSDANKRRGSDEQAS